VLDALIHTSLRHRGLVLLLAVAWVILGLRTGATLPVDVFPDLNRPAVTVLTEAGGLSPEEVELRVTRPIELAMAGAPGVLRTRSQSAPGLSVVWVELDWGVDVWRARQQATERLVSIEAQLPPDAHAALGPVTSIMGEILLIGVSSPDASVEGRALRTLAEATIRPVLLSVPGTAAAVAIGGGVEQIAVEVDPWRLAATGVRLDEVRRAAAEAQGTSSGGFLHRDGQEVVIRNLARTTDPQTIGQTIVRDVDGAVIRLADLARVTASDAPARGRAGVNGAPAVVISVQKQPGVDTVALTRALETAIDQLRAGLPPGVELTPLFRQADFIEAAIHHVIAALRDGAVLVVIVLMLFLLEWRTTLISLVAIPTSLLTSVLVLHAAGLSLNTMTLGGLAVATGELVDDAIVDVENVWRRLRERRSESPIAVIAAASSEVRSAIVHSTALVVLVFVPLFALSGIEGRLFLPLGVAYVTSITASMLVSLTLTPALCAWLLPDAVRDEVHADGWLVRQLKQLDAALLRRVLPAPRAVLTAAILGAAAATASLPWLPTTFLPDFHEGTLTINLLARPGVALEDSDRLGALAERLVLEVPEVRSVGRRTGRAEGDEHAEGVHYTELDVDLVDRGRPREALLADLRASLGRLTGVSVSIGQPISHRLDHLQTGVRAALVVKIFGPDTAGLADAAAQVSDTIRDIPGLVDLAIEPVVLVPQARLRVDPDAAERLRVTPGAVLADLETAWSGTRVATIPDGARTLDLVVRYGRPVSEPGAWTLEDLAEAPLSLSDGRVVPIEAVADVRAATGPNQILHEDGRRRMVVSANVVGDVGAVATEIEARLRQLELREGYTWAMGGQHEAWREAATSIAWLAGLSLAGMVAALWSWLRHPALVAQVLINVPLALIGSVAALWISGGELGVATLVGFVTLCGIATRNTILMLTHYVHLAAEEGMPFGPALVLRGSLERLVPVVMTALCAGIALVPLAIAGDEPGNEILTPVAQVVLGGLCSSTLLDLLVTPTLFLAWGREGLDRLVAARQEGA
jgi:CzcA family heavy metal efflux pump